MYTSNLLNTPIEYLRGVGPQRGDLMRKELQITCFGDLLHYYPFRYIDKTKFTKINQALASQEAVQVIARVQQIETIGEGFKKRLVVTVRDDTGEMELIWFQSIAWILKFIFLGDAIVLYGKANAFNGALSITHPEVDKYDGSVQNLNWCSPSKSSSGNPSSYTSVKPCRLIFVKPNPSAITLPSSFSIAPKGNKSTSVLSFQISTKELPLYG